MIRAQIEKFPSLFGVLRIDPSLYLADNRLFLVDGVLGLPCLVYVGAVLTWKRTCAFRLNEAKFRWDQCLQGQNSAPIRENFREVQVVAKGNASTGGLRCHWPCRKGVALFGRMHAVNVGKVTCKSHLSRRQQAATTQQQSKFSAIVGDLKAFESKSLLQLESLPVKSYDRFGNNEGRSEVNVDAHHLQT
jgi:hypothetical protein